MFFSARVWIWAGLVGVKLALPHRRSTAADRVGPSEGILAVFRFGSSSAMCNTCGEMVLKRRKRSKPPTGVIGWREYVGLPDLGIPAIKAKIDTGARTSALHVEGIRISGDGNVAFSVPYYYHGRHLMECVATLLGSREIRSTSGSSEERLIIKTAVAIGQRQWHIEVSLADRSNMGFDLILGRTALRRHGFIVDPSRAFLAGEPAYK